MRNKRIFTILLCMVMLTAIILPVRADDRIYWHDDANDTINSLGVYAYYEATITGSGPKLTAETTLTFIPNSNNTLPSSSYYTALWAEFKDNGGHNALAFPAIQSGMEGHFTVSAINDLFNDGHHLSSAKCHFKVNGNERQEIDLP